jgi:hypothetical protein
LAASLSTSEARAALLGFMLASTSVVVLILASSLGFLQSHPYWQHLLEPGTNKTIGASILLSMLVAVLMARGLTSTGRFRWLMLMAATLVMTIICDNAFVARSKVAVAVGYVGDGACWHWATAQSSGRASAIHARFSRNSGWIQ